MAEKYPAGVCGVAISAYCTLVKTNMLKQNKMYNKILKNSLVQQRCAHVQVCRALVSLQDIYTSSAVHQHSQENLKNNKYNNHPGNHLFNQLQAPPRLDCQNRKAAEEFVLSGYKDSEHSLPPYNTPLHTHAHFNTPKRYIFKRFWHGLCDCILFSFSINIGYICAVNFNLRQGQSEPPVNVS